MEIGTIITILFLLFFFILPMVNRQRFQQEVERVFAKLQKKRKSRIIAIVHRQEPMALLGVAQLRYIDLNDSEDVLNAIRSTPKDQPIEMILHTPGGLVLPALQIARALKAHPAPVTVFVPHYAMSGGTLIAMAADQIVLNSHAVLGPIDPQIGGLPAASIGAVVNAKSADAVDDYTLILNDVAQKAQQQLERAARELLRGTVSDNAAVAVAEQMSSGRWTHDYPIGAAEAAAIGLNVSDKMPEDISLLMMLFPDRLSGRSVTFIEATARAFGWGPRRPARTAPISGTIEPPQSERLPFTGYEPGPGARSFSYGPWRQTDLLPNGEGKGPSPRDVRRYRERGGR